MRIRTIKPEFWDDDTLGAIPRDARLLFIATWNLADDEGILRWTPAFLKAGAFMYDDDITEPVVSTLMTGLVRAEMMFPYSSGRARQRLCLIVNFRKHQKINRPQPGKFPPPLVGEPAVIGMYARRDEYTCHLCGGAVNKEPASVPLDPYSLTCPDDLTPLNASPDHLVPRSKGGSDYPSNIRTAHLGCNKSRRDRPIEAFTVPDSVSSLSRSLNESVSESLSRSLPEGKGREGKKDPSPTDSAGGVRASVNRSVNKSVSRSVNGSLNDETARCQALTTAYVEVVPLSKFPAVLGIVRKAVRCERYTDDAIRSALLRLAADGRAVTVDSLRTELEGLPTNGRRRSTKDPYVSTTDTNIAQFLTEGTGRQLDCGPLEGGTG